MAEKNTNSIYDVSIFIVSEFDIGNSEIISPEDFDARDGRFAKFIMMTSDVLNTDYGDDNTIFISMDWTKMIRDRFVSKKVFDMTIQVQMQRIKINSLNDRECMEIIWQVENKNLLNKKLERNGFQTSNTLFYPRNQQDLELVLDFGGQKNTDTIILNAVKELQKYKDDYAIPDSTKPYPRFQYGQIDTLDEYIPAVMMAYNTTTIYKGKDVHGYLPAISQLGIIDHNLYEFNKIYKSIANLPNRIKLNLSDDGWWSSTEDDKSDWSVYRLYDGRCGRNDKTRALCCVLPLFSIKV